MPEAPTNETALKLIEAAVSLVREDILKTAVPPLRDDEFVVEFFRRPCVLKKGAFDANNSHFENAPIEAGLRRANDLGIRFGNVSLSTEFRLNPRASDEPMPVLKPATRKKAGSPKKRGKK